MTTNAHPDPNPGLSPDDVEADAEARVRTERRGQRTLWIGSVVVALVLFVVALRLMGPPPPRRLTFAAGPIDGQYHRYAERYRESMAENGIEIEVLETAGSVENLELLASGKADVGFVQGGTRAPEGSRQLASLASIFLEPLWIFHRSSVDVPSLTSLEDERIAVGPPGSGTRWLALRLLAANGYLDLATAADDPRLLPLGGTEAAEALLGGRADVGFFVVAPEASYVRDLLDSPDVHLLPMRRHAAYERRYRYLQSVVIPQGILDLDADVPHHDLRVLAPTATLVAPEDLHASVIPLLIASARTIHGTGSLLSSPGSFPSPHHVTIPLNKAAIRYFDHGPSWLYRAFPFWIASFLDRAILLLLPLVTLLFPLLKTAPPLYRWALRRRIYRWYRVVRHADRTSGPDADVETLRAELDKMRAIEQEVANVSVPLPYMKEFYDLREHMEFATRRLKAALRGRQEDAGAATPGASA